MKFPVLVLFSVLIVLAAACTPASRKTPGASNNGTSLTTPAAASVSSGAQNVAASAGNSAKGKTLFGSSCASCHGPEAKGLPNLGKDLTSSAFVKEQSDKQLLEFVKKGRAASDPLNTTGVDMPPKGGNPAITDGNLNDIISFLRSVNH